MEDDVRRTTHHALDEFYRRVGEPDKLVPGKIETLRRRYAGREGELVRGLWNKYGCVPEVDERAPAPPLPASAVSFLRRALRSFCLSASLPAAPLSCCESSLVGLAVRVLYCLSVCLSV